MPTAAETRQALERADRLVTLAPGRGRRTYANTARVDGGTVCQVVEKGHRFVVDAGRWKGRAEAPLREVVRKLAVGGDEKHPVRRQHA